MNKAIICSDASIRDEFKTSAWSYLICVDGKAYGDTGYHYNVDNINDGECISFFYALLKAKELGITEADVYIDNTTAISLIKRLYNDKTNRLKNFSEKYSWMLELYDEISNIKINIHKIVGHPKIRHNTHDLMFAVVDRNCRAAIKSKFKREQI